MAPTKTNFYQFSQSNKGGSQLFKIWQTTLRTTFKVKTNDDHNSKEDTWINSKFYYAKDGYF